MYLCRRCESNRLQSVYDCLYRRSLRLSSKLTAYFGYNVISKHLACRRNQTTSFHIVIRSASVCFQLSVYVCLFSNVQRLAASTMQDGVIIVDYGITTALLLGWILSCAASLQCSCISSTVIVAAGCFISLARTGLIRCCTLSL